MKFLVVLAGILAYIAYCEASCVLYSGELECAKQLGWTEREAATVYHSPNSKRIEYTNCVWNKLGYQKPDGSIDYEKIRNDAGALLTIARVCDDVPSAEDPQHYQRRLSAAINTCKNNTASHGASNEIAENVRKCIQEHL